MVVFLNLSPVSFRGDLLKEIVRLVLEKEKVLESDLSVVLVSRKEIRELNRRYRQVDEVTNVLSFEGEKQAFLKFGLKPEIGEIFICPEFVAEDSKKKNIDFEKEMSRVLIHGLLHLLGYDHVRKKEANEMWRRQEYYFNTFWLRH